MNSQQMDSTRKTARLAGLLYVLGSLPAPFALLYLPGRLIVSGNATATAERVRANEGLLRLGIAAELVSAVAFIFAVLVLFRLFRGVSEGHARAMLLLYVLSVPVSFLNVLNNIAALSLAKGAGNFLSVFDAPQRDALAYLFVRLHSQGVFVAQIFWGLWLFPLAVLVMRSRFIPRFLGILLIIAGCGYVASSFAQLTFPQYAAVVYRVAMIAQFGELPIVLWLLIWGARPARDQS